jgi:pimeloyl-ACP methyl ester carboxylesterase
VGAEQVPVLKEYLRIDHNDIHFLDAGHFVQEEVPDEIVNKIIEFIG